ncbi:MAG: RNA polymerase subunit sigma-24 [Proteobacteria bacterium]|nr:MAG: RNA polymerase subunit sigma-24 [Pseudomonadota bacterium]
MAIDFEIHPLGCEAPPPAPPVVDAETFLVRRLRAGDEDAYTALMRANGARMLAAARRVLHSDEDARDAVQEAWLHAFRALPRFEGHARLSTWLHRIAVNAALMKLRAQRRRPETSLDELPPRADACDAAPADEDLVLRERRALVRRAIERLAESHRSVLELRDLEELDTDETARRLGITAGAVKTRLHRARQALRAEIEREPHAAAAGTFAESAGERAA